MLRQKLASILSATLLILCFPKPGLGFLAWFTLVPCFFALKGQRPARTFLLSYLVGLIFFSGVVYWINYVSSLGFSVLVLYLALYFGVFGLVFALTVEKKYNLIFVPCLWVALEYIRSHLLFKSAILPTPMKYRFLTVLVNVGMVLSQNE